MCKEHDGVGENYQIGFVNVCDRTYRKLVEATRIIGETMYNMRSQGTVQP